MTTLICDTKTWDGVRPRSVKKTGLSEAIGSVLKAMPGGNPGPIKDLAACAKAQAALDKLIKTLTSAAATVAKAKDDSKGASGLLTSWLSNATRVQTELAARCTQLCEAHLTKLVDDLVEPRKALEKKAIGLCGEVRSIEQNLGHAKQMRQECFMAMSRRRGQLQLMGVSGTTPEEFVGDKDFKEAYDLWNDAVEITIKAARHQERIEPEIRQIRKAANALLGYVEEATNEAGHALQLRTPAAKAFIEFKADVVSLVKELTSESSKSFGPITTLVSHSRSDSVRTEQLELLARNFKRLGPDRAQEYLEQEMAKHQLNDKQLRRAESEFKAAQTQAQQLAKTLSKAPKDPQATQTLRSIAQTLAGRRDELRRGRTAMEVVQFLSKNPGRKKELDAMLGRLEKIADDVEAIASKLP